MADDTIFIITHWTNNKRKLSLNELLTKTLALARLISFIKLFVDISCKFCYNTCTLRSILYCRHF